MIIQKINKLSLLSNLDNKVL